jgi:hypothetical protein
MAGRFAAWPYPQASTPTKPHDCSRCFGLPTPILLIGCMNAKYHFGYSSRRRFQTQASTGIRLRLPTRHGSPCGDTQSRGISCGPRVRNGCRGRRARRLFQSSRRRLNRWQHGHEHYPYVHARFANRARSGEGPNLRRIPLPAFTRSRVPARASRRRPYGQRHSRRTSDRAKTSRRRHSDCVATLWRSSPSLQVATSGVDALRDAGLLPPFRANSGATAR